MTAATLAASVGEGAGGERLAQLVTQVARIVRSQLCAAFGNVGTVALAAIGFDLLIAGDTGHSFLTPDKADYVLRVPAPAGEWNHLVRGHHGGHPVALQPGGRLDRELLRVPAAAPGHRRAPASAALAGRRVSWNA